MQLSWTESCNYSNVLKAKNKIENEKYANYIEESDEEAENVPVENVSIPSSILSLGTPRINRFFGIQSITQTKRQLNHSDGSSNSNQSSPDSSCSPPNKIANQNELNNDKECTLNFSRSSINISVEDLSCQKTEKNEKQLSNSSSELSHNSSKANTSQKHRKHVPDNPDTAETLEHFMES